MNENKTPRPVLKYPGSKWKTAEWIISLMPPHKSYLEPFFGSGAVFFKKPPSRAVNPCPFDNRVCACQLCEEQCNNGLNCAECRRAGKAVHTIELCTGFVGDIKQHVRNWMRHNGEKADT